MTTSNINTVLAGAAVLLAVHITAVAVLCYLVGTMMAAALVKDDGQ